jgi:hypothetical protein
MLIYATEQVNMWKSKYDALAKLCSQLHHHHLELLGKYKQMQHKEASAQSGERNEDLKQQLRETEEELQIFKQGMDDLLLEVNALKAAPVRFIA